MITKVVDEKADDYVYLCCKVDCLLSASGAVMWTEKPVWKQTNGNNAWEAAAVVHYIHFIPQHIMPA